MKKRQIDSQLVSMLTPKFIAHNTARENCSLIETLPPTFTKQMQNNKDMKSK